MKNIVLSILCVILPTLIGVMVFSMCDRPSNLTDLSPENGFEPEPWFDTYKFYEHVSTSSAVQDTGFHIIDRPEFLSTGNLYIVNKQWISTDTFVFEQHDYESVLNTVHEIANGFNIINTQTNKLSYSTHFGVQDYYRGDGFYLFPLFSNGNVYWLQVFRRTESLFRTYYTARAIWLTGSYMYPDTGDIS